MAREAWWEEEATAGHIVFAVRKQRATKAGEELMLFFLVSGRPNPSPVTFIRCYTN